MTKKIGFDEIEKVMRELVIPFYRTERAVPLLFAPTRRHESDAEHSWSLALIACMIAPHIDPSLDVSKVCQFAIVHDLSEVYAGDTSAFATEGEHQTKEERERQALQRIKKEYGDFAWLTTYLEQYERQDTDEARYVRAVDKIIPLFFDYITEGVYYHENQHTREDFEAFMQRPREKARAHPAAFALHEEVFARLLAHPELFHPGKKPTKPTKQSPK